MVLLAKRLSESQCSREQLGAPLFFSFFTPFCQTLVSRYFLFLSFLVYRCAFSGKRSRKEVNPGAQSLQAGMFWAPKLLTDESELFLHFKSYYTFKQTLCREVGGKNTTFSGKENIVSVWANNPNSHLKKVSAQMYVTEVFILMGKWVWLLLRYVSKGKIRFLHSVSIEEQISTFNSSAYDSFMFSRLFWFLGKYLSFSLTSFHPSAGRGMLFFCSPGVALSGKCLLQVFLGFLGKLLVIQSSTESLLFFWKKKKRHFPIFIWTKKRNYFLHIFLFLCFAFFSTIKEQRKTKQNKSIKYN